MSRLSALRSGDHAPRRLLSVAAIEQLVRPVCDWSQAQLGGYGREHFATVEDAMRRVGVPFEAHDTVLRAMRFVDFDEVFTVHSLTYGALALDGRTVAGFGKTYYWVGGRRVDLPTYAGTSRTSRGGRPAAYGDLCPDHHVQTSLSGECDLC